MRLNTPGDGWGEAMAEVGLGLLALAGGRIQESAGHFARGVEIAEAGQDVFTRVVAGNNVARVMLIGGDIESAEGEYGTTLSLSARLHYDEGAQYAFEGLSAIAAVRGDGWRAGALAVAAAVVRQRIGVFDVEGFAAHVQPLATLRASDPEGVAAGERAGAAMSIAEAVAIALPDASRTLQEALAEW